MVFSRFRALIFLSFHFMPLVQSPAVSLCTQTMSLFILLPAAESLSPAKQLSTEIAQKAAFISVAARPGGDEF